MLNKIVMLVVFSFLMISKVAYGQFISQEAAQRSRGGIFSEEHIQIPQRPRPYQPEVEHKIALIINGEMVTSEDINARILAFSFNTRIPLNAETADMIRDRVIQNTIDEKIKLNEALKENVIISERDINDAIEGFAGSNNLTSAELINELKKEGVSEEIFREQMKSDISWLRLVRKKTSGEIEPSQKEINRAIEQIKKEANFEKFMISEIVISKNTAKNLDDLVYNLRNDPRFALYAMQFSEAPSASKGGNLGWVAKAKLYPQLQNALSKMSAGDISEPILVNDNYYIIKLERKYNPETDKISIPSQEEVRIMIEGKRLEEYASTYINKLRQKAIVEIRD